MTRDNFDHLAGIYWPIAVGIAVFIWIATVFLIWHYRAERVGDRWPKGKSDNTPVELSYAFLLACVVAVLLYFTYSTMNDYGRADAETPGLVVNVTGAKWNWRFDYPKYGITSQGTGAGKVLPTLTVPVDTPIRFHGTSDDVMHAFFIPYERFQRHVFPGRVTHWTLSFDRQALGMHREWGRCAQFCGLYHAYMQFNVHVMTKQDFRQWAQANGTKGSSG